MGTRRSTRISLALAAALLLAPAPPRELGEVRGTLALALAEIDLASLGPIAVYLEPLDPRAPLPVLAPGLIRQRDAEFLPGFSIAAAGSEIKVLNDDDIFHNVFSFSGANAFDLGLYPRGESRTVRLQHPGEVHVYCSIHESMSAVILVVPTPYFAQAGPDGAFRIRAVVPGRYRLRTWNATLPPIQRELAVGPGAAAPLELTLGSPE
jgi:hypothetical protein